VSGAYFMSANGDRLMLADKAILLKFLTAHGVVNLDCRYVLGIAPVGPESDSDRGAPATRPARSRFSPTTRPTTRPTRRPTRRPARTGPAVTHKVTFINGSVLYGSFADAEVTLVLKRDRKVTVEANRLAGLHFVRELRPDPLLSKITTVHGEELFGALTVGEFRVSTEYGSISVSRTQLESIDFKRGSAADADFKLRNGTVLKGRLSDVTVGLEIAGGMPVKLQIGLLEEVHCRMPLPPRAMIARIEQLIAQLGAESRLDRKAAIAALARLGPDVSSVLKRYLKSGDPKIRSGIWQVMIKLGTGGTRMPTPPPQRYHHLHERL